MLKKPFVLGWDVAVDIFYVMSLNEKSGIENRILECTTPPPIATARQLPPVLANSAPALDR